MKNIKTFVVVPSLPESLKRLKDIAYNMLWSWDHDAIDLFRRLDNELWDKCQHNPVMMLGKLSQERLDEASHDAGLLSQLERVSNKIDRYMSQSGWCQAQAESEPLKCVAYFSAEFGIHECLPLYSGGLGVLAGDHLKSASDLALPLVGVGLLYRLGYFQQYLNADGWQQESYPQNDFYNMPVTLMKWDDGRPVRFHVDIAGRNVVVQIWRIQLGRINLYLLDTNLRCNRIDDRQITAQLYGGDNDMRLRQEIILGIGGFRALQALNIDPSVCHMNEGHAAFMALERTRWAMEKYNLNFSQAAELVSNGNVFTTHTPVPAGHDKFAPADMEKYFSSYCKDLGLEWQKFLALGRKNPDDVNEPFSMTNLALHLSIYRNGVSKLHGKVSQHMELGVWPDVPEKEIPITSVTNGIHIRSWISHDMSDLFDRYLGPGWDEENNRKEIFERIKHIPDEELWRTHERRRERLVSFARKRLQMQLTRRGASPKDIARTEEVLDPEILTIGFARRFATYKRGTLLFRDMERFVNIVANKDKPVQFIFAGKAHPKDTEGKELIRKLIHYIRDTRLRRNIIFLENYDINVARHLIQGVDVWLNTPRRGMEASGTSGMKVLANGGLNLSILDGWWCEGYLGDTGWAIGQGESYTDNEYADDVESRALYDLLEKEVIPLFYERSSDKLPRNWIKMMKSSMRQLSPQFSTSRMVSEYASRFYMPSADRWQKFIANNAEKARILADWKESIRDRWNEVSVGKVDVVTQGELAVGGQLQVRCQVQLGSIDPSEVKVEVYHGLLDANGDIPDGDSVEMKCVGTADENKSIFEGFIPCKHSGLCGFSVRVIPYHPDLSDKYDVRLVCWDKQTAENKAQQTAATEC